MNPAEADASRAAPESPSAARRAASPLVGREREIGMLLAGLEDAASGQGRTILIGGEPGIGKSRLVDELATHARGRGATVLWGRCWEAGGAPAYWPWLQALRSYLRDRGEEAVRHEMGRGARDIAQMLPEIRELIPDLPEGQPVDTEGARFRLFESTAAFLRAAAAERPLVLILDDLQAADAPSLLLLQFVGRELGESHILIAGAYRDVELGPDHPLIDTLADLSREQTTRRLYLRGLVESDVALFIQASSGVQPSPDVVRAVHRETEGNPLFIGEVVRLLAADGQLDASIDSTSWRLAIPEGIRQVIGRRVGRLSKEAARTLSVASVLGREFDLGPLEALSGLAPDELIEVLDEAAKVRLLSDVPGTPGRLRFAHSLIRETLYDELPPARRARLHLRAGVALESLNAGRLDPHLAELAHHFFQALPGGEVEKAIDYARRAADSAAALLAYEEAVRLYEMALRAHDLAERPDEETRCNLLVGLGESLARAGAMAAARRAYLRAAQAARSAGLAEPLGRAAVGYGGRFVWPRAGTDSNMVPLLQEALRTLPDEDSELRVRIMARLAGAMRDEPDRGPREHLSGQAVAMAERLDSPRTLAYALMGRFAAMLGPDHGWERLNLATELVRTAEAANDPELIFEGHLHRMLTSLLTGNRAYLREFDQMQRVADELRQPAQLWLVHATRAMHALLEGRLADAEGSITEASHIGNIAQNWDADVFSRVQMFGLRKEQGRLDGMEAMIQEAIHAYPTRPLFRCILANLFIELGREKEARTALDAVAKSTFAPLPLNNDFLLSTSMLAEVVAGLGDRSRAAELHQLLLPYAEAAVDTLEMSMGAVSRALGMLAATLSLWDQAVSHFEAALELNAELGARSWVAHTRHDYARMLVSRDGPGDPDRAAELLGGSLETARELGLTALEVRNTALIDAGLAQIRAPMPSARPTVPVAPSVFRREGEYWSVAFEGKAFRLKDTKGLRYMARLLNEPGREFHAMDLVGAERELAAEQQRAHGRRIGGEDLPSSGLGDAGEILDQRAKVAYRARLAELEEDLDEADRFGDTERAARAKEEMDFLARELAAAVGLGGRNRVAVSAAERARVNVTRAIRASLSRIQEHSPALGKHLETTVKTGVFCSYTPDPRVPVSWQI